MNKATYRKTLDVQKQGVQFTVNAVKNEALSRQIILTIVDGGKPFDFDSDDLQAVLYATKPDGTKLYNNCVRNGNTLTYAFTQQTLTCAGDVMARIRIVASDSSAQVLYAPQFIIQVEDTEEFDLAVESTNEYTALTTATANALSATSAANEATRIAEESADAAQNATIYANLATQNANEAADAANDIKEQLIADKEQGVFNGEKGDKGDAGVSITNTVITNDHLHVSLSNGEMIDAGSAGTSNYNELSNKPQINNIELEGNKTLEDLNIQEMLTSENLKTVGGQSLLGAGNIELLKRSDIVVDDAASDNTTYSSNKINSLLSVFNNTLNVQVISTEEEFNDFFENMNTHTLYLIDNDMFGSEYYDNDCYVEIIVTEVGEDNFQYEIIGSTAIAESVVIQYTYSKQELDNYGVKNIPSPLKINNSLVSDVINGSAHYRDVRFLDSNEQPFVTSADRNNVLNVYFPVEKGKKYVEKPNIQTYGSNPFNITLKHNTEHRCIRPVATLNLSINDELNNSSEFESSLILWVDEKNFTFTAPENITWTGDDCVDSVFTPQKGANYEINIKWLGRKFVARVGAF